MAKQSLSVRVGSFLKSTTKINNVALSLTCETIEHAIGDSGDWTLLARLVKGADAAQARVMKDCARKLGLTFVADTSQPTGMAIKGIRAKAEKAKADNAAMSFLADLQVLAGQGESILGAKVKTLIEGDTPKAEKPKAAFADLVAKAAQTRIKEGEKAEDVIASLQAVITKLQASLAPVVTQPSAVAPTIAPAAIVRVRRASVAAVAEPAH